MKFKKCGPEHEASYLFEVDKNWMRSGNDFSELLESIRKEAYLKGFRRGQEEASYGFWNKDCRKKFREDEETDKIIEHEHFGRHMTSGRSILEKPHRIWRRLHTGVMRMEKMPLTA